MTLSNANLGGLFAILIGIAAGILGTIPRFDVAMLGFLAVLLIVILAANKAEFWGVIKGDLLAWVLLGFCLYLLASAFWAVRVDKSLTKALLVLALVLTCLIFPLVLKYLTSDQLHRAVRAMVVGLLLGLGYLLIELLSEHAVMKLLLNTVLETRNKFVKVVDAQGYVIKLNPSFYNKNIALVIMALWPVLLGLTVLQRDPVRRRLFIAGILLLATVVTFLFNCETAKLALVLGVIGYLGATYVPVIMHRIMTTVWIISVVLIIPMVHLAWNMGLPNSPLLFNNAVERLQVWRATVDRIPENPIFGIGINATRDLQAELQKRDPKKRRFIPGKRKKTRAWHAHNMFLQTWYELGAAGAAFLLAIGILLLHRIHRLSPAYRPAATATFAAVAGTAAVGWGMWQSWLIAGYAWAAIFLLLVIAADRAKAHEKTFAG